MGLDLVDVGEGECQPVVPVKVWGKAPQSLSQGRLPLVDRPGAGIPRALQIKVAVRVRLRARSAVTVPLCGGNESEAASKLGGRSPSEPSRLWQGECGREQSKQPQSLKLC